MTAEERIEFVLGVLRREIYTSVDAYNNGVALDVVWPLAFAELRKHVADGEAFRSQFGMFWEWTEEATVGPTGAPMFLTSRVMHHNDAIACARALDKINRVLSDLESVA